MKECKGSFERNLLAHRFRWVIYFGLVAIAWLVNYPGRLNPDSYDMLTQAQHVDTLNDWHSPAVIWLWSLFTPLFGQPAGALLVQSLLIFVYPVVAWIKPISTAHRGPVDQALSVGYGVLLLALIPLAGAISKDQILVGLILCLLAIIHNDSKYSRVRLIKSRLCYHPVLAMILFVRPSNFIMMAIAGLAWAFLIFGKGGKFLMAVVSIAAVCALAIPATSFVNSVIFGAKSAMSERSLMIFDVAGISAREKIDLFGGLPDWPTNRIARPWECYTPAAWDQFGWGACKEYSEAVEAKMTKLGTAFVMRWWSGAILHYPYSYIEHRLSYFWYLLRKRTRVFARVVFPSAMNALNSDTSVVKTYGIDMTGKFQLWEPTIRYRPFGLASALVFSSPIVPVTVLSCLATLVWSWRKTRERSGEVDAVIVVSSAIGIGNLMMLLLFGISDDGRYLLPTVICGGVSILRLIQQELDRRQCRVADSPQSSGLGNGNNPVAKSLTQCGQVCKPR